jgi:phosphonate transport system substrate-binding protein
MVRFLLRAFGLVLLLASPAAPAANSLTLALFPNVSRVQLVEFHTPLKRYLEAELKRPVELVTAPDFLTYARRTLAGEYDLILSAPHIGRLAEKRAGFQRLVMTGHEVQAVFLVQRESPIRELADLKGRTVMIAQPGSIIYQMAVEHLRQHGLVPGRDVTIVETGTHNNALYAPARGEADASATGILLWMNAEPALKAQLRELDRTPGTPGLTLHAHPHVEPALREKIRAALLRFPQTPEGRAYFEQTGLKGFRPIDDQSMKAIDPFVPAVEAALANKP